MNKLFLFIFLLFANFYSFSQKISYTSNGNIQNSEKKNISPNEVRVLLKDNQQLLDNYNAGRDKKTIGNVSLIGGPLLIVTDLILGLTANVGSQNGSEKTYPSALTYIGFAAIAVAIPVKIGFSKKIRNVVSEFNSLDKVGFVPNDNKLYLISNSNGIGLRLTLN